MKMKERKKKFFFLISLIFSFLKIPKVGKFKKKKLKKLVKNALCSVCILSDKNI